MDDARLSADQGRQHCGLGVRARRVFVFLVLAAQFESLTLPLSVTLIVPMCLVASITGVILRGMDNNILTQVGFVVLIGLAAKNTILIVEFGERRHGSTHDIRHRRWAEVVPFRAERHEASTTTHSLSRADCERLRVMKSINARSFGCVWLRLGKYR